LILVGSGRKNGNTDRIAGMVRTHLQEEAARTAVPLQVDTLYMGDLRIDPCRGCRTCFDRGEDVCPLQDDLLSVRPKCRKRMGL
jgi:multimeric flavodoxin WrbA